MDPELWRVENYPAFLDKRRSLLAAAANEFLRSLRAGEVAPLSPTAGPAERPAVVEAPDEEAQLVSTTNDWVISLGLAAGERDYELINEDSREVEAILDLAWPDGLQTGLSAPVALLLNEESSVEEAAGRHGFRFFTSEEALRHYVRSEILEEATVGAGAS
jgi:hypothetical protein